ncbi:MAG: sugar ABC transporter permease [Clostridiales bacterium]|nr:sugar ABC transporter permease [Clostridiales bacterium]
MVTQQKEKRFWKAKTRDNIFGLVTAILPLVVFFTLNLSVLIITFVTQFCNMDYYNLSTLQWNNFANFKAVFTDARFGKSLLIMFWLMTSELVTFVLALVISVLISQKKPGSKLFQVLFFVPYICSSVAVSLMWMRMFDYENGIINSILVRLFGERARVSWRNDPAAFTWQLYIVNLWKAPGYGIVMFKAALGAVDKTLYEAADIDGATKFKQFFSITLPSIAPTSFYLLFSGLIAGIMAFDVPKLFAGESWTGEAGIKDMGLTPVLYSYIRATTYNDIPTASVISYTLFVITVLLTITLFKVRDKMTKEA